MWVELKSRDCVSKQARIGVRRNLRASWAGAMFCCFCFSLNKANCLEFFRVLSSQVLDNKKEHICKQM
jgi:hypothetical protein